VLAHDQTVQPGIVADDGLPVAGRADVKFEALRSVLQGEIECGEGVFWRVAAGAAMSEQ
jgi:hypothetical protein